jgi:hypothetical protein
MLRKAFLKRIQGKILDLMAKVKFGKRLFYGFLIRLPQRTTCRKEDDCGYKKNTQNDSPFHFNSPLRDGI